MGININEVYLHKFAAIPRNPEILIDKFKLIINYGLVSYNKCQEIFKEEDKAKYFQNFAPHVNGHSRDYISLLDPTYIEMQGARKISSNTGAFLCDSGLYIIIKRSKIENLLQKSGISNFQKPCTAKVIERDNIQPFLGKVCIESLEYVLPGEIKVRDKIEPNQFLGVAIGAIALDFKKVQDCIPTLKKVMRTANVQNNIMSVKFNTRFTSEEKDRKVFDLKMY